MKPKTKKILLDILAVLVGGFIWALAINTFIVPNDIASNGVTGLATIINHFTSLPIGVMTIVLNIPIFFLSWKTLGFRSSAVSGVIMAVTSIIIDVTALFLPAYDGSKDPIITVLVGGLLSGLGLGIIYARGLATGGVDVIARVLEKWFPFISYGNLIIFLDVIVVTIAAITYGNLNVALYSLIVAYLSGYVTDRIQVGLDRGKLIYVISENLYHEIEDVVMHRLGRGVTQIKAMGAYTRHQKGMLMIVCRPYEVFRIRNAIRAVDPNAFVIVSDVTEVLGEGFKNDDVDRSAKEKPADEPKTDE